MLTVTLCYTEHMKPHKKVARPPILGEESIAYMPVSERSTTSLSEHQDAIADVVNMVGQALDSQEPGALAIGHDGMNADKPHIGMTGGRSEKVSAAAKVTAKPSPPLSPKSPKPLLSPPPSPKSPLNPDSDMPVLGDLMGVHQKEGVEVVYSPNQVPFTPGNDPPFDTNESKVSSPFITGNERIDRRTAFTQYCRLGEGRTYIKVAEMMGVPLESIKKWANEDNWENAYRERATADVIQVAKEENIHDFLDMKRVAISLLRKKLEEARAGKEVFKSSKEMLDALRQIEELTGAKDANTVQAGQIVVIINEEEWQAREKMNEKIRKEESI